MTHISALLCILCCALGSRKAEKFEIKPGTFADAWQSSVLEDTKKCFRDSANNAGHGWLYFHSSNIPDSGYQWLLLKLNSGIRVLSVTVHGRKAEPVRAHNIEILLGARLPNDMETAVTCTPKLTNRLEDFLVCGRTKSDNAILTHEVKCNTSICTQYVLIRKYVKNETVQFMNFVNLEIEKAPNKITFHACTSGGGKLKCNSTGLRSLAPGNQIIVKVCSHCQPIIKDQSNCSLKSSDETKKLYNVTNAGQEASCLVITNSELNIQKHGWHFQCDFRLASGEILIGNETVGFVVTPKDAHIQMNSTQVGHEKFWVAGKHASFKFVTDYAFPKASHKCWLINSPKLTNTPSESVLQGHQLTFSTEKRNGSFIKVTSNFELFANSSVEGTWIRCQYELEGHTGNVYKEEPIPVLLYPCQANFSMPQRSSWTDGSTKVVTMNCPAGNRVATSQTCYLETKNTNTSLIASSPTNLSSDFTLNVTRQWGKSASIVCLVNQSGILVTWIRQQLPSVLYKANNLTIRLHPASMRENSTTTFTLESSDAGNPSAVYKCNINGRNLGSPAQSTGPQHSPLWEFKPQSSDDKQNISCLAIQMLDGNTLFTQTVNSSKLNVQHKSKNEWNATQPHILKEGELLSVEVTSIGGNPVPSHQCWLNGSLASMTKTIARNTHSSLVSSFSLKVTRQMDRVSVMCRVTQEGHTNESFSQLLTVFYKTRDFKINELPAYVYDGISVTFSVSSVNGNPSAVYSCRVQYGNISNSPSHATQDKYQTQVTYIPDRRDTRVECWAVQMYRSKTEFSQSVFQNISVSYASYTKIVVSPNPIKEGSIVNVTLVSSGGRPAVSSFKCWVGDNKLLLNDTIRASNATSAIYLLKASRTHHQLIVKGKFQQDEKLITWHNTSLTVYFPANKPNSVTMPHKLLRANSTTEFSLGVSDNGNPPAKHFCYITGQNITMQKQVSNTDGLSLWNFIPSFSDSSKVIICHIVQTDSSGVSVYNQTVSSEPLNVTYPSINSWSATQLLEIKEGELLSVAVTSVGGNPAPSHQCWMQSAEDKLMLQDFVFKKLSSDDKMKIVSNFSVTPTRHMNRGFLMCSVTQEGQADMTQQFSQNISVLYNSTINLTDVSCNGTHIIGKIAVTDGNPLLVSVNCSVSDSDNNSKTLSKVSADLSNSESVPLMLTLIATEKHRDLLKSSCEYMQNNQSPVVSHFGAFKCNSLKLSSSSNSSHAINDADKGNGTTASWLNGIPVWSLALVAIPIAAVVTVVAFFTRKRWRRSFTTDGQSTARKVNNRSRRKAKSSDAKRRASLDAEQEFKRHHYLYKDPPSMEYASVVNGQLISAATPLSASTETIYLDIIGHLAEDGVTIVRCNSSNGLLQ